ncbi:SirB2 family protein [Colwellia sp. KU-HH00111]|uniref:SirB2 family protein n=1 Tax=Colwellia sp. KU-HH00111 TaxID=3127652 RepID=UPI0031076654
MFKHLHMTLAALSVALFTLRFIWLLSHSAKLNAKWVKITPHIIDTLLLGIGVMMAVQYSMNPFEQLWLGEKLLAIIAYIFTGYYTLKLARTKAMQIFGYLGAIGWVMLIVRLAMTREPMFFL